MSKPQTQFYDPLKTFWDNFDNGPFPDTDPKIYQNRVDPQFTFLGKKISSPFGIPAGPLPTSKHIKYAFERGFDVNVYKTQRSVQFACNEFPNILYLDIDGDLTLDKASKPQLGKNKTDRPKENISITNSFGNPSKGPEFWVDDLKKAIAAANKNQLVIMSVVGTIQEGFSSVDYFEDFAKTARLAADAGAEAIEINLSCPNVASEGVLCYSPDAVASICKKTKEQIGNIPLIAKLGYYSFEQEPLLRKVIEDTTGVVDGIASINTISAPVVDEKGKQALPGKGRLKSGICGAGVKWAGLDMVKRLNSIREELGLEFEIIGVGGVMTPSDFHQYRKAGADLVQSATGAMWNPDLAAEIKETLR